MAIFYPLFALVMLTFVMAVATGASRLTSVRRRDIDPKYYRLMTGATPPDYVQKTGRNFANLLETPVLFYLLGALVIALDIDNVELVQHAWLYVALRLVHTIIHVSYNNPIHRFLAFVASLLTLLAMWIQLYHLVG
ncbi:MAPEG family protein [Porticoccaceae bacterium]|jgi:hypothetical protein|nr:MAPEG family protein [Porticoccaceae bacterium]